MSFTPSIPASGQSLGSSRLQILNNFANYNTVVSVDHVDPNSSGEGKHKWVHLPPQSPLPTAAAGELVIFSQTANSITTPYWRRDTSTTNVPLFPIKAFSSVSSAGAVVGTAYNITPSRTSTGLYLITLSANAVASANVGIFICVNNSGPNQYTYSSPSYGAGVLTFNVNVWAANGGGGREDRSFSVMVVEFV